jgi:hypothetical protein
MYKKNNPNNLMVAKSKRQLKTIIMEILLIPWQINYIEIEQNK